MTVASTEWRDRAACLGDDQDVYFPESKNGYGTAKQVCWWRCPVRAECLAEAYRIEGDDDLERRGMWGGLTPPERTRYRKGEITLAEAKPAHRPLRGPRRAA